MSDGIFSEKGFIRTGGSISFQERGAQPSDFTSKRGYTYANTYAESQTKFSSLYPNWQHFADCFIMRRSVIQITGKQHCHTASFNANDLKEYKNPSFVRVKNFKIPDSDRSSIPNGKYQLVNLSFSDEGNSFSTVTLQYQQYGEWELVKLIDNPPLPTKGA